MYKIIIICIVSKTMIVFRGTFKNKPFIVFSIHGNKKLILF